MNRKKVSKIDCFGRTYILKEKDEQHELQIGSIGIHRNGIERDYDNEEDYTGETRRDGTVKNQHGMLNV